MEFIQHIIGTLNDLDEVLSLAFAGKPDVVSISVRRMLRPVRHMRTTGQHSYDF